MILEFLVDAFEFLTGKSTNKLSLSALNRIKKIWKKEIEYGGGIVTLKGNTVIYRQP